MEEQFPDTSSEFAEEGTKAHAIGELKILYGWERISAAEYGKRMAEFGTIPGDMSEYTDSSRDFVMERYNMDRQTAENYYMHLWLMSFSYSALIVTNDCPYTFEQMSNNLTQISLSLCKAYKEIPGFLTGNFDKDMVLIKW